MRSEYDFIQAKIQAKALAAAYRACSPGRRFMRTKVRGTKSLALEWK